MQMVGLLYRYICNIERMNEGKDSEGGMKIWGEMDFGEIRRPENQ